MPMALFIHKLAQQFIEFRETGGFKAQLDQATTANRQPSEDGYDSESPSPPPNGLSKTCEQEQARFQKDSLSVYLNWLQNQQQSHSFVGKNVRTNALLLRCEHWLEAADEAHRYGSNLRPFFDYWVEHVEGDDDDEYDDMFDEAMLDDLLDDGRGGKVKLGSVAEHDDLILDDGRGDFTYTPSAMMVRASSAPDVKLMGAAEESPEGWQQRKAKQRAEAYKKMWADKKQPIGGWQKVLKAVAAITPPHTPFNTPLSTNPPTPASSVSNLACLPSPFLEKVSGETRESDRSGGCKKEGDAKKSGISSDSKYLMQGEMLTARLTRVTSARLTQSTLVAEMEDDEMPEVQALLDNEHQQLQDRVILRRLSCHAPPPALATTHSMVSLKARAKGNEEQMMQSQCNFFRWLDEGSGKDLDLSDMGMPRSKLESERVIYLAHDEVEHYEVVVDPAGTGRLVYKLSGIPLHTVEDDDRPMIGKHITFEKEPCTASDHCNAGSASDRCTAGTASDHRTAGTKSDHCAASTMSDHSTALINSSMTSGSCKEAAAGTTAGSSCKEVVADAVLGSYMETGHRSCREAAAAGSTAPSSVGTPPQPSPQASNSGCTKAQQQQHQHQLHSHTAAPQLLQQQQHHHQKTPAQVNNNSSNSMFTLKQQQQHIGSAAAAATAGHQPQQQQQQRTISLSSISIDSSSCSRRLLESDKFNCASSTTLTSHTSSMPAHTSSLASHTSSMPSHTSSMSYHTSSLASHTPNLASHTCMLSSGRCTSDHSSLGSRCGPMPNAQQQQQQQQEQHGHSTAAANGAAEAAEAEALQPQKQHSSSQAANRRVASVAPQSQGQHRHSTSAADGATEATEAEASQPQKQHSRSQVADGKSEAEALQSHGQNRHSAAAAEGAAEAEALQQQKQQHMRSTAEAGAGPGCAPCAAKATTVHAEVAAGATTPVTTTALAGVAPLQQHADASDAQEAGVVERTAAPIQAKKEKWIYVVDTDCRLYVHKKKRGEFHHSSFLCGSAVLAAGGLKAEHGRLMKLNADSGHYWPKPDHFRWFYNHLESMGADVSGLAGLEFTTKH